MGVYGLEITSTHNQNVARRFGLSSGIGGVDALLACGMLLQRGFMPYAMMIADRGRWIT
jgi:hypothetical protein